MSDASNSSPGLYKLFIDTPIITRSLLLSVATVTLGSIFMNVSYSYLSLNWGLVIYRFEDSLTLETTIFKNRAADYAWFLTFCSGITLVLCYLNPAFLLVKSVIMAVIEIWTLYNSDKIVSLLGIVKMKAQYFPYVMLGIEFFSDGGRMPYAMIYGYGAARLYYYLTVEYPQHGGTRNFVQTPQFYYRIFGNTAQSEIEDSSYKVYAPTGKTLNTSKASAGYSSGMNSNSHFWGKGKKLS
ncbi:hypothetical protein BB561_001550 [Smittium simulii]|uniref:Derlin n=1 Tax=Smittium simulii TaxID=133385 RepID=A0A2T9YU98_9FUNG|nr:hypothetical protein BB561_001550 [Smittium simulii]